LRYPDTDSFFATGTGLGDDDSSRHICAIKMTKHVEFGESLRTKGKKWQIVEKAAGANQRTRDEAIKDAQRRLKLTRGTEVSAFARSDGKSLIYYGL
jgi:hypothetical protein